MKELLIVHMISWFLLFCSHVFINNQPTNIIITIFTGLLVVVGQYLVYYIIYPIISLITGAMSAMATIEKDETASFYWMINIILALLPCLFLDIYIFRSIFSIVRYACIVFALMLFSFGITMEIQKRKKKS